MLRQNKTFPIRGITPKEKKSSPEVQLERIPPNSLEAEKAIFGGIFLKKNPLMDTLINILKPEDFYYPVHRILYQACLELYRTKNTVLDMVTLNDYLQSHRLFERIGGSAYLAELAQMIVSGTNAEYYAHIIKNRSIQRSLIDIGSGIVNKSYDTAADVPTLLDESENAVFSLAEKMVGRNFKKSDEIIQDVLNELSKRLDRKERVTGIPTGFHQLNELTAGFQPSDLIIIAARPAMGKTAFALNIAMRAALHDKIPVAIFSLEMSMNQLITRMLCAISKVTLSNVRTAFLGDEDLQSFYGAAEKLSEAPLFIDDTPALSPLELRARTRRMKAEHQIQMVVVDYLQLMRGSFHTDSREQEISEISRSLKSLAKELDIPVVALSQLNRKVEERGDKRPMLSDLRESGAIEQDADVIMFIYRDEVYNKDENNPNKGTADIIIGKQRNGPTGEVKLSFQPQYTAFESLELGSDLAPSEQE